MEMTMVNLIMATSILAGVNVVLGSLNAWFNGEFDGKKLLRGVGKAIFIIGCVFGIYYSGSLVPDIAVMEIDGNKVNLMTAIHLSGVTVFALYGKQAIEKLMKLLTGNKS